MIAHQVHKQLVAVIVPGSSPAHIGETKREAHPQHSVYYHTYLPEIHSCDVGALSAK